MFIAIRIYLLVLPILFVGLFPCTPQAAAKDRVLTIGRVTSNPKKNFQKVMPFGDYIATSLAEYGYTGVEVAFARDSKTMARMMVTGQVDIISDTVFSSAILMKYGKAVPILREWRSGVCGYKSVLFQKKGSGIDSIKKMGGKVVAFEDPGSTSAYYLPAIQLRKAGFELVPLPYPTKNPGLSANQVGYVFAGNENNVALWVSLGRVDVGALSDLDMQERSIGSPGVYNKLAVLYESEPYPRAVLLVNGNLEPKVVHHIKTLLLNAHNDHWGKTVMKKYRKVTRYDEITKDEISAIVRLEGELY